MRGCLLRADPAWLKIPSRKKAPLRQFHYRRFALIFILILSLASIALAQTTNNTEQSTTVLSPTKTSPSGAEIAAANSRGMVWVNTESGIYHKGGRWYGKTKSGKFMTEADANAAGYKPGKN